MLFGEMFSRNKAAKNPRNSKPGTESFLQFVTDEPYGSTAPLGRRELADLYNKSPWVRSIVGKVAGAVARQGWYLAGPGGKRVDEHPALDFVRAGCPKLRGRTAIRTVQTQLDLSGETFLIVGRNADGVPTQWAPLASHFVIDTPNLRSKRFRIQPRSGAQYELDPEDVIHLRDPDPTDPFGRGSPLTGAVQTEVQSDEAAANFLHGFFRNNARPSVVVSGSAEAPLRDEDRGRLEESWIQKFRGVARNGRPLFSSRPLEIKEIGSGLRENQTTEIRADFRVAIAEFYGVPPEILGRTKNSNRATIDAADFLFAKGSVDPRLAFLLDEIEPFIEENFDLPSGYRLAYESPIKEDGEFLLKAAASRARAFSDNEIRAAAGKLPIPGGDEYRDDAPETPDPNEPDEQPTDDAPEKAKSSPVAKMIGLDDAIRVSAAHEDPQVRAEATRMLDALFLELIEKFGSELLETLASEADFIVAGNVAEFIAREVPGLIGNIDETTRTALRASLATGVAENEAVAGLIARVEAVFDEAARVRSPLIGTTIATKLAGYATQAAAEQGGIERKKWLSTRDHVVRDTHRSLDGQTVHRSQPFVSASGARAMHPGAFGKASEDVNCRCAMRPVFDGEKAIGSDAEFVAFFNAQHEVMAEKIASEMTAVFAGQRAVVVRVLETLRGVKV